MFKYGFDIYILVVMKILEENGIKLKIPQNHKKPEASEVFYNPEMALNRQLSVASAKAHFGKKSIKVSDPFCASGIRAIQYAKELNCEVAASDISQRAVDLTKENADLNNIDIEIKRERANKILYDEYFDLIDVDPFGTPAPFLLSASRAVKNNGMLGITATDAPALCGVYPNVCLRNYGAVPLRTEYCHEIAMRILIGSSAKASAVYEKAIEPKLVLNSRHFFRLQLGIKRGAKKADKCLENIGFIRHCFKCGAREMERGVTVENKKCKCGNQFETAGPLWTGKLFDKKFCRKILKENELENELKKQIELMIEEAEQEPLYYNVHEVFRGRSIPKLEELILKLKENGFKASRTHFSPVGIRTDAGIEEIKNID